MSDGNGEGGEGGEEADNDHDKGHRKKALETWMCKLQVEFSLWAIKSACRGTSENNSAFLCTRDLIRCTHSVIILI